MLNEITPVSAIILILLALACEYTDSTLGMGYGTILTPLLMAMGIGPEIAVPAILFTEFVTGLLAGVTHHLFGNANFRPKTLNPKNVLQNAKANGLFKSTKENFPRELKVALFLGFCSLIGALVATFVSVNISKFALKMVIGTIVTLIGVFIIVNLNRKHKFSWPKITILGLMASFNKGISGGGYGPLVTGGQLLVGIEEKQSIAITSIAEGLTCGLGLIFYWIFGKSIDFKYAIFLLIGAVLSVPLSGLTVKKMKTRNLKLIIGLLTLVLGGYTIIKTLM